MFTGIITAIGSITRLEDRGDLRARIDSPFEAAGIDPGASIACDGICLTVVDHGPLDSGGAWFDVDISSETVSKTAIRAGANGWREGGQVNLERALRLGDELGGHIVSGHVDGVATVVSVEDEGDSTRFRFRAPPELARFIAPKGSVALSGTSLTVNEVEGDIFGVNIIPHTREVTTWGDVRPGDPVNLEIDTLARYVARLAEASGTSGGGGENG